ncbi:MAG: DNA-3-methyladenine glycosylase family protein [Rhodospirillales bacterium]
MREATSTKPGEAHASIAPEELWRDAVEHLRRGDAVLGRIIHSLGPCGLKPRPGGFPALMDIITAQQVSKYAADSIRRRLRAAFGDPPEVGRVAAARPQRLRGCGLSGAKAKYIRGLARAIVAGRLDFDHLHAQQDAAAIERLVAIDGIGRWTAEIYLMFVLTRPDIFPIGDGALRNAIAEHYSLRKSASLRRYEKIAASWAPYRTVASWYLYAWINRARAEKRTAKGAPVKDGPMV